MRGWAPKIAGFVNRLNRPMAKLQPHSWIALAQHARIVLDEFEVTLHSPDQIAPVGVLHPVKFHLEAKDASAKLNPELLSSVVEVTENVGMEETVMGGDVELAVIEDSPSTRSNDEVQVTLMSQRHGVVTISCWRQHCEKLGEHGLSTFQFSMTKYRL